MCKRGVVSPCGGGGGTETEWDLSFFVIPENEVSHGVVAVATDWPLIDHPPLTGGKPASFVFNPTFFNNMTTINR